MKKTYKFTIILVLVILIMSAVIIWSFFRGTKLEESGVSSLPEASIPTVTMEYQERQMNCLQGYTCQLDKTAVDAVLTPLAGDKKLKIHIGDTEKKISAIEYAVYRQNGGDLVEERRMEGVSQSGDSAFTLELGRAVDGSKEYLLEIMLETDEKKPVYYYTRVQAAGSMNVGEALDFVTDFCRNTFDKNANDKITTYIEPDSTGNNTTLQHVNIHSSYEQVTWGELPMQLLGNPVFNLLEMDPDGEGAVFSVDYQTMVEEDEETNSYYLVHEYYRVRKSQLRMHLLEFDRELTQTFIGTKLAFGGQSVMLGILPEDAEYVYDKEGSLVCWEQAGELWLYEAEENRLYKVFSMQDTRREDKRSFMQNYDIHILKMDEDGNVDFVVSGYGNRGTYEGKVCVLLCHYAKKTNSYEVRYEMEDTRSESLLCQEMACLSYLKDNRFYYFERGNIRCLDISMGEVTDLVTDLETGAFVVSEDNRYVSWVEDMDHAKTIRQIDLDSETVTEITGEDGEYLRPIGYVGEDFAYGKAKASSVKAGVSGELWFPMYKVVICDREGNVIKDYTDESLPVTGGQTTRDMINLQRVTPASGGTDYTPAQPHQIVSSSEKKPAVVTLETVNEDEKQTQVCLKFEKGHASPAIHMYTASENGYFEPMQMETARKQKQSDYYVYLRGRLAARFRKSRDAFAYVAENGGIIRDAEQTTLYYQAAQKKEYTVKETPQFAASVLQSSGMEEYPGIVAAWQQASGKRVLDATGVPMDTVRYLTARGDQVLIRTGENAYVLVTGYTEDQMTWWDPVTGQTTETPLDQAETVYRQYGNVCIVAQ